MTVTTTVKMTEPRKRPFWQLHLSTALLLVILVGVLLGLDIETARVAEGAYGQATFKMMMRDHYVLYSILIEIALVVFVVVAFERDIRRNSKS